MPSQSHTRGSITAMDRSKRDDRTLPLNSTTSTPVVRQCVVSLERTTQAGQPLSEADRRRPGQLRRMSCALLRLWGLPSYIDSVELLISELVTNALRHGEGPAVGVRICADAHYLHVYVRDGSPHTPVLRPLDDNSEDGRGLHLVAAVVDRLDVSDDGMTVHCALALPERAA
ncbi:MULTISPECIES: ATP-binding protein [unclassified Streptomyces]|uniref:ATP-binding protein n=1 Tax=unclassified Streptomyces TaxID=2593676 RepID=UPI000823F2EC|nr:MULTISPECIES: ATP-binding protein [unclassified Streptomyces]MYU02170.1 ATP-binding protein [Streptomyces sp. SID8350]SCK61736.1 Anti-sigma regulatory factor (Ser/Thr protein kinase) [Streptomyces sp. AmelKG-D3]